MYYYTKLHALHRIAVTQGDTTPVQLGLCPLQSPWIHQAQVVVSQEQQVCLQNNSIVLALVQDDGRCCNIFQGMMLLAEMPSWLFNAF